MSTRETRHSVDHLLDAMVVVLLSEAARQGLSRSALEKRMGWREGRLERLCANPRAILAKDAERMCHELGTNMARLCEAAQAELEPEKGAGNVTVS